MASIDAPAFERVLPLEALEDETQEERNSDIDWYWEKYQRMVYNLDFKLSRKFGYPKGTFLGSLFLLLNRCANHYQEEKARFTTYFYASLWRYIWPYWLKHETEAKAVNFFATRSTVQERRKSHAVYGYHLENYYLYRIPERDQDWVERVMECFDTLDELWEFLTRYLEPKERFVLLAHYRKKETYREIGERLSVTKQRVQQIEVKALRKVKTRLGYLESFSELFS